jgi:hypothetical protein
VPEKLEVRLGKLYPFLLFHGLRLGYFSEYDDFNGAIVHLFNQFMLDPKKQLEHKNISKK